MRSRPDAEPAAELACALPGANLGLPSYLHADHQGSIVAVSGPWGGGSVNTYDEYGIPGAANVGRFQYTGQIWLPELGMYHYKARIYSPTLGRFLQTDPIGYDDQFNLYAYVGNDPVNGTDPAGTCNAAGGRIRCGDTDDIASNEDGGGDTQINRDPGWTLPRNYPTNPEGYGRHHYDFFEDACEATAPGCTLDAVFEAWRHNSAPGAPYAERGVHDRTLTLGNPIRQTVNVRERTILNETRPGHSFHYGTVRILIVRRGDSIGARIIGHSDRGRAAITNQIVGPIIFRLMAVSVHNQFHPMEPLTGP